MNISIKNENNLSSPPPPPFSLNIILQFYFWARHSQQLEILVNFLEDGQP